MNRDESRERDSLEWLKRAKDKMISQRKAARRMGVTDRWVRKLSKRMKRQGEGVVVHGLRGRVSAGGVHLKSKLPTGQPQQMESLGPERIDTEYKFFNRLSADQVFLHDALDHFRRDRVVPDAVGIHHRDRALFANLQAIGLSSIDAVFTLHQPGLNQPLLQIFPGRIGHLMWSALRFGLIRAKKDVALEIPDSKRAGFLREVLLFV